MEQNVGYFRKMWINLARLSFFRKRPQNAIPFDIPFLEIKTEIFCSKESALFVSHLWEGIFNEVKFASKPNVNVFLVKKSTATGAKREEWKKCWNLHGSDAHFS